jgi:hypothetical protein
LQVSTGSVLYGFSTGLESNRNQFWHQDTPGIEGAAAAGERFGESFGQGNE